MLNGIATPELDKMLEVKPQSQVIGEFLDWLQNTKHYSICELIDEDDRYVSIMKSIEQLLAEYFGIDLNEVERE